MLKFDCTGVERWWDLEEIIESWELYPHNWIDVFLERLG
jgi:hypothetical protein